MSAAAATIPISGPVALTGVLPLEALREGGGAVACRPHQVAGHSRQRDPAHAFALCLLAVQRVHEQSATFLPVSLQKAVTFRDPWTKPSAVALL